LANETGLPLKKLQAALTAMERNSAIIRVHVFINGRPQRRIFPSAALIPPAVGGVHTPQQPGGENLKKLRLPRSQFETAALQARRREEADR
jgi:hypothetical protein